MRNTKKFIPAVLLALGAAFVLAAGRNSIAELKPAGSDGEHFHSKALVGVWTVQVQLLNCQTQAPIGPAFSSLLTFNDGGTMSEATTNPAFAPGQRGDGQGIWSHEGHGKFSAKSVVFINFTTPPNLPLSPGFKAGTQTIAQDIEFKDDDDFTSSATIQFADTTGAAYRQGCASADAKRFE